MSLQNYINEALSSGSDEFKNKPTTKEELRDLIKEVFEKKGHNADLNFIDTSAITDMSELFRDLYPQNIKIDKWDTSNVTKMNHMFVDCMQLKTDISDWDTSNVTDMQYMFCGCRYFNGDLSEWDVDNVETHFDAFEGCEKMTDEMLPKFQWN